MRRIIENDRSKSRSLRHRCGRVVPSVVERVDDQAAEVVVRAATNRIEIPVRGRSAATQSKRRNAIVSAIILSKTLSSSAVYPQKQLTDRGSRSARKKMRLGSAGEVVGWQSFGNHVRTSGNSIADRRARHEMNCTNLSRYLPRCPGSVRPKVPRRVLLGAPVGKLYTPSSSVV
jgi:hypothetical protein